MSVLRRFARASAPSLALVSAALLGGCATLPSSGPTARQIVDASTSDPRLPMEIVEITADVVQAAAALPPSSEALASLSRPGEVDRVGPGDVLQITIFEIGTTLFSGTGALQASGGVPNPSVAGENLPPVTIAADGTVTLPYVGRIDTGDRTVIDLQAMIEAGMRGLSQQPQVLVSVRENIANTVFVMGVVKAPGRQALTLGRERLLDAIAAAGGPLQRSQDMAVRFTRGGRSVETGLNEVRAGDPNDLVLLPNDRIELIERTRSFTVFGATDKVSEVRFDAGSLSLAQAIARIGGPADRQADPTAVFLFRWEPRGPQDAPAPIIYRLDLMRPESYFLAQRFAMRHDDVLYIANARSNQASKLVQIINQLFSPFYGVRELTR